MPIYEYKCESCGHYLDIIQKFSDAPLTDCPDCGEAALKKLLSAPSFRLKGGGWYETDFKKDNRRNLHDSAEGSKGGDGKDAGKGGGKDGDKAAAKPAGTESKSTSSTPEKSSGAG